MNVKYLGIIGLVFLLICQIMFALGFDFLTNQKPIDFAHWFMLIGAVLMISFSFVFPKSNWNTAATALTILGIVAHIGMCAIDFSLWSFGSDMDGRNELVGQLMNTPSVWIPFMVGGPPLLYIGLSIHAWAFIKTNTSSAVLTLVGSMVFGMGQMVIQNRIIVLIGFVVFAIGLILLAYSVKSSNHSKTYLKEIAAVPVLD